MSAITVQVEILDFTRLPTAKAFISYLGLTPSKQSGGEKVNRNGITKQGNFLIYARTYFQLFHFSKKFMSCYCIIGFTDKYDFDVYSYLYKNSLSIFNHGSSNPLVNIYE
ncbi:transposase, partial [Enterococcus faecium]|uniref:transposase n=1 Tax=Enterococcus faecium TaxID=1352 RepID=UPI0011784C50